MPDPAGGPEQVISVVGIYADEPTIPGVTCRPVKDTWTTEVGQYVTAYAVRSAIWLAKFPL